MILVIGGAYQGKLTWAAEEYGLQPEDCLDLAAAEPAAALCVYHLESLSRRADAMEYLPLWENSIVISREVGSGVVPMDAEERLWRERHGALLKAIAQKADRVVRIFCGLPEVLK